MVNKISGTTTFMGLLGNPVDHSKSPIIHNTAFEALGLDHVYMAFKVEDGKLNDAVKGLKALGSKGGNITMPYKTKIIEYLDEISPEAKIIGSVNTIKIDEDGKVTGYNTDGKGFVKSLEEKDVEFKGKKIVIAGAGGASKAIAIQLAFDGAGEIVLFNRTLENAISIADNINKNIPTCKASARIMNEEDLVEEIEDSAVLVNCTSIGMKESIDQAIISSPSQLPSDIFVADIIYDPEQTKLLKIAQEAGCKHMNGLKMLIWQGAIAFKIWTDKDMPVDLITRDIFGE
ncbi:MAG: shikimate dehydrogenase [Tissierellia bacterium]|nr:shikimate dehydrogenase [Tissierellia bacterium]